MLCFSFGASLGSLRPDPSFRVRDPGVDANDYKDVRYCIFGLIQRVSRPLDTENFR
jgi:hypothetical protein